MRRLIQACAYLLVLVMISAVPARAQLLDEIIKRGKVQIAVDTGTPPFGITDANTRLSPYGIGIKRGDSDLLQWLNAFVFFHKNNGDLAKIYEKWVGSPLPDLATF
jgi:ABC-type amino acid transport substrate-binding protein